MTRILLSAIAVSLATPANAQEQDPLRLAPSSAWVLNYADETCELLRKFGAGEEEVTLILRAGEPGGRFLISAIGQPLATTDPVLTIFVNLGDVEQVHMPFFAVKNAVGVPGIEGLSLLSVGPVPNPRETVPRVGLPGVLAVDPANEQRMNYLALQSALERDVVLETGGMGEPLAALRACTEELMTHWGIDLEKQRTLSRRPTPRGNPQTWISPNDYPGGARRNGLVRFRLIVDEKGKVAECAIQGATQPKDFAQTACSRLSRRARFQAALDSSGQPIRSYYTGSVTFMLPSS
jgi:hypothetical protein